MKQFLLILIVFISFSIQAQKPIFFEKLYDFKNGYALVQNGDKKGFIDVDGNLVGQMDVARTKYTNTPLNLQGKSIYIEQQSGMKKDGVRKYSGEYILEPEFSIQPFYSFFIIRDSSLDFMKPKIIKVMNEDGGIIYSETLKRFGQFPVHPITNDLIGVQNSENSSNDYYAIKGLKRDFKTDYIYRQFGALNEGFIKTQRYTEEEGKLMWGFIDEEGKEVIDFMYTAEPSDFSDGKAVVKNTAGKFGYIDTANTIVIEPQFIEAYNFVNGKAVVRIHNFKRINKLWNEGYRLINIQGEIIFDFGEFRPVKHFSSNQFNIIENGNIIRIRKGEKYALFYADSLEINETSFSYIGKFDSNRTVVQFMVEKERKTGYANEKGELVLVASKKNQF